MTQYRQRGEDVEQWQKTDNDRYVEQNYERFAHGGAGNREQQHHRGDRCLRQQRDMRRQFKGPPSIVLKTTDAHTLD